MYYKNSGLILEGGGMRGVYTAGVLDYLLEKDIMFSDVYGVSAGSCVGGSYISRQKGRAFRTFTEYLGDKNYCSVYSLLTTGDIFNAEFSYHRIPEELDPYDYQAFDRFPGNFYAVLTDIETGKAVYHRIEDMKKDIDVIRASASLPLLSRNVKIGDHLYLDGGVADSIPLAQSLRDKHRKNLVILTRHKGYRKTKNSLMPLVKARYHRYPKLVAAIENRHKVYNQSLRLVQKAEEKGLAFVIQPEEEVTIGRLEKNPDKLYGLYLQGYEDARNAYPKLVKYMEREEHR